MAEILLLSRSEVRGLLDGAPLLEGLERAFTALSEGRAAAPPRASTRTPDGMLLAMPGFLPGAGLVAKLISVFPGNAGRGLPTHTGLLALFDPESGIPLAVMDAEEITAARTAGASAVAARLLAREDARILAILGAGVQGRAHLEAVSRVRRIDEVRIASRTRSRAAALAESHPAARPVPGFEAAVRGADIVCCCTDATAPVLRREWLAPGAHVGSVGSTRGAELDEATVREGRVFVEWRGAAVQPPPVGAIELQGLDPDGLTELGEVLAGRRPGRRSGSELTVYKSTGHAVEDAAAASLAYERALAEEVGRRVEL